MAIQLKRYSSTALPQKDVVDPATAAAAAAAPFQFGAQVAGVAADFTQQLYTAEQESKASAAVAEAESRLKRFTSGVEWELDKEPDQLDDEGNVIKEGRPMEEVKAEQWTELTAGLTDLLGGIQSRSARTAAEAKIQSLQLQAELDAQDKIDKMMLRRGKNRDFDSIAVLQGVGDFDGAATLIKESQFLSPAERKAARRDNQEKRSLKPYLDVLATGNVALIDAAAAQVLDDLRIEDPDKRMSVYKQLILESDRLDAEMDDLKVFEDNYLKALPAALDGSLRIEQLVDERDAFTESRFDTLVSIIRGRSQNKSAGGETNQAGHAAMNNTIRTLMVYDSRDPTVSFKATVEQAKRDLAMNPNIDLDDLVQVHGRIDSLFSQIRSNPQWRQLLDVERAAMTGITESGFLQVTNDSKVETLAYEEMEQAFWNEAERAGPGFNAEQWLVDNRYQYRKRALEKSVLDAGWQIIDNADGTWIDVEATQESIMAALREKQRTDTTGHYETQEGQDIWIGKQMRLLKPILGH